MYNNIKLVYLFLSKDLSPVYAICFNLYNLAEVNFFANGDTKNVMVNKC